MDHQAIANDVASDLLGRYHGNDPRVAPWLGDIAAATAYLVALQLDFQCGTLRAEGLAYHGQLHRDLSGLLSDVAEVLGGDINGSLLKALVETAGLSWQRYFTERSGIAGHA